MRVIVNTMATYRQRTGVGSYIANLMAEMPKVAGTDEIAVFPEGWMAGVASVAGSFLRSTQAQHILPKSIAEAPQPRRFQWRGFLKQFGRGLCRRGFQLTSSRGQFDLYHEPNFIPWPSSLPVVLTVHDLSVLLHPEWHPVDRVRNHEQHFVRCVNECRHVITVSETIRQETIRYFGLPEERVTAVHNGVRSDMRPMYVSEIAPTLERYSLPSRYVLFVGSVEPRKNLLTLMRAYCGLPEAVRRECPLILAGLWGWNYQKEQAYYQHVGQARGVRHLGYVGDEELPALYNGARVLAYPSHYEGFGLPPVEMLSCGGCVIASTAPALREVLGNHAVLISPLDEDGWRDALHKAITDDDYHAQLRQGGSAFAGRYSWARCAEHTWQVYRKAASL